MEAGPKAALSFMFRMGHGKGLQVKGDQVSPDSSVYTQKDNDFSVYIRRIWGYLQSAFCSLHWAWILSVGSHVSHGEEGWSQKYMVHMMALGCGTLGEPPTLPEVPHPQTLEICADCSAPASTELPALESSSL